MAEAAHLNCILGCRIQEAEFANQLINQAAGLGGMNPLSKQPEVAEENPSGSTAELAQQLGQLQLAVIDQQQQEQAPPFQPQNPNSQLGYPPSNQRLPNPLGQGYQGTDLKTNTLTDSTFSSIHNLTKRCVSFGWLSPLQITRMKCDLLRLRQ